MSRRGTDEEEEGIDSLRGGGYHTAKGGRRGGRVCRWAIDVKTHLPLQPLGFLQLACACRDPAGHRGGGAIRRAIGTRRQ